jgi:predicted TIM-barrel fold metal-dependent hydrolase
LNRRDEDDIEAEAPVPTRPIRIDAHVHAFPDRLALRVRDALNREGRLTASPLLPEVADSVLASGFDCAWILSYAHRAGVAADVNEWSAREVGRYPYLVAGATFHPGDDNLPELVELALVEFGLRVVKLHCSVGQFSPADSRLAPLWETASAHGVPVVVHAGQRDGGSTAADELLELEPVLTAFPALRIVLAHAGNPNFPEAVALMRRFDNLYADLTPVWDRPSLPPVPELRALSGRFLFGSDAPNNPASASQHAARIEALDLEPAHLDMLLGGAADSLLAARV